MSWQRGKRDLTSLKVGSAVLLGGAILIFGLLWGQDLLQAGRMNRIVVVFDSGFGLSTGDPVLIAGVKKGQVSRIALTPENRVAVEMMIENDIHIFTSSIFTIESEGLIGSRFINVTSSPGGTRLAPGDTLTGLNAASLNDVFRNVQVLMVKVEELTTSIQAIITDPEVRRRIAETFANFDQTVQLLNRAMVENQDLISNSLESLSSVVANVNTAILENMDDFEGALQSVKGATDQITTVASTVDSLSSALTSLIVRFSSGQGTFWRMAESDTLYVNMSRTLARLDSLISDITANPRKYFKFSIF